MMKEKSRKHLDHIVRSFNNDLNSSIFFHSNGDSSPMICCVCDSLSRVGIEWTWIDISDLAMIGKKCLLRKEVYSEIYPEQLLDSYGVCGCTELEDLVVSPRSVIDESKNVVAICQLCWDHFESEKDTPSKRMRPPNAAICMGYVIGSTPTALQDLNDVEKSLVSLVQTSCQSWIYFAGCHQHIQGWHTFYKNNTSTLVGHLDNLSQAGMRGMLLVVLCGPFTTLQKQLTRKKTVVNAEKVIRAFMWLKANNFEYRQVTIPHVDDLPIPQIVENDL